MSWQTLLLKHGPSAAYVACGLGAACIYAYPYTYGLDKYKEMMVDKTEGAPHNLAAEIIQSREINDHFKWKKSFHPKDPGLQFIQSKHLLDLTHNGCKHSKWSAVIALPILFTESSMKAARENPVAYLQRHNINGDLQGGQALLDLFTLSPAAKKFALAREMCHASTMQFYINVCAINASFLTFIPAVQTLSWFIPVRGAIMISVLTVVPVLGYMYIKAYDLFNCYTQTRSDKKAASIEQSVADGGVEYYTKLIALRQALAEFQTQTVDTKTSSVFDMTWRKRELSFEERRARLIKASKS